MRERQQIAIIGMSGVFPQAEDLRQFYLNLCGSINSIQGMPQERRASSGFAEGKEYIQCGYMNRIDEFDHQFFNISRREAEQMEPQQRWALQLACAAIENAGYSLKQLRGTRTSVSLSALENSYSALLGAERDGLTLIGNITASVAGKVSYYLDLRGPAVMIDTSCSSSLVAIHDACSKLILGEADYAIAGGLNLYVFFPEQEHFSDPLGIAAPDGRSKTFDADADGTGIGEGAGILLLKPLEDALRDRDHIHAVIRASAINQDGGRSNGLAAPSPLAQTEVILDAWRKAGIDPDSLTFIEAHGTGTYLGDPIEVQGLTDAFRQFTDRRRFCAVSSVKTNIGHLGFAAGVSGLMKATLALKHRKLFPSLNFKRPNPHIDFENSPLFVNTELRDWDSANGSRRAAVSSFGITGTNAHVVLEEAPEQVGSGKTDEGRDLLVTLSAKTPQALREYARQIAGFVSETDESLADISFVLNAGRDDYDHRFACVVDDKRQLADALLKVASGDDAKIASASQSKGSTRLIFLCSGDVQVRSEVSAELSGRFVVFKRAWDDCRAILGESGINATTEPFVFQYALSCLWRSLGVRPTYMLGTGVGNFVVAVETGRMNLDEALAKAVSAPRSSFFSFEKLKSGLDEILSDGFPVFLEMGHDGVLSRAVRSFAGAQHTLSVMASYGSGAVDLLETLASLYVAKVPVDWEEFYRDEECRRVEVPTYPFEKTRCWVDAPVPEQQPRVKTIEPEAPTAPAPLASALDDASATETERKLAAIWTDILKLETLAREDDYFDIGGNSLSGTQIVNRIEHEFGVRIEFEDIYDYPTLKQMAAHVDELRASLVEDEGEATAAPAPAKAASVTRAPESQKTALSYAQERLFHLYQLEPASPFYNMPGAIRLEGKLDVAALERSLNEILRRHEVLRTTYTVQDGEAWQVRADAHRLSLPVIDLSELAERETEALSLITAESARPFDLLREIPLRARLVRLSEDIHILLLTMHHIASDSWSVGIFFEELAECYEALSKGSEPRLPELAIQYADYACWQREWLQGSTLQEKLDYWKRQLGGAPSLLAMPYDRPRPAVQTFRGASLTLRLPADLTAALNELSRGEDVTLFMTLLAAFNTLLYRYSGQEDISVGSPVANRTRVETEKLIGFFANTLVLRCRLSGAYSFRRLVREVRDVTLKAYTHQDLPFEKLVQELSPERNPSYTPLFQVAFALQNVPLRDLRLPGLALHYLETESTTAKFDLTLSLTAEESHITGIMEYNTDLFDEATVAAMLRSYTTLLESVVQDPDQPLSTIPLLSEAERHEMLFAWNDQAASDAYEFN
ncbi:MAG TPA: condensation domain-containing protein [Pyrinomonadaceae bacterium]|nr:condensation domain-containing protein [Pyrinomonadaceae bacterium]